MKKKNTFWGILILFFFWGGRRGDFKVDYKNDILKTFQKNFNKGTIPVQCKTTCKYYVSFEKYMYKCTYVGQQTSPSVKLERPHLFCFQDFGFLNDALYPSYIWHLLSEYFFVFIRFIFISSFVKNKPMWNTCLKSIIYLLLSTRMIF